LFVSFSSSETSAFELLLAERESIICWVSTIFKSKNYNLGQNK
jgi:hypothetical protein